MRALVPFSSQEPSVPAIPPCEFDAAFARAVASPGPAPGFKCGAATGTRSHRFRRRLLDLLAVAWRIYVVLCVVTVTAILVICLGIVSVMPTHSGVAPPPVSPGRPAVHSASHAPHALTGGYKFQGSLRLFEPNDDRAGRSGRSVRIQPS